MESFIDRLSLLCNGSEPKLQLKSQAQRDGVHRVIASHDTFKDVETDPSDVSSRLWLIEVSECGGNVRGVCGRRNRAGLQET